MLTPNQRFPEHQPDDLLDVLPLVAGPRNADSRLSRSKHIPASDNVALTTGPHYYAHGPVETPPGSRKWTSRSNMRLALHVLLKIHNPLECSISLRTHVREFCDHINNRDTASLLQPQLIALSWLQSIYVHTWKGNDWNNWSLFLVHSVFVKAHPLSQHYWYLYLSQSHPLLWGNSESGPQSTLFSYLGTHLPTPHSRRMEHLSQLIYVMAWL